MIPYYAIFTLILLLIPVSRDPGTQKNVLISISFLLIIFAGLRANGVDPDYDTYQRWFEESLNLQEYLEYPKLLFVKDPAYQLLFSTFREYGFNFGLLMFFFAFLGVMLKMRAIYKMSYAPLISVLIYFSQFFLLQEMTQIRAGIAAGFFLMSIPYLVERRLIPYLGIIFVAACFHYSAFIFLPLFFLKKEGENINWYLFLLMATVALAAAGVTLDFIFVRLANIGLDPRLTYYVVENSDMIGTTNIWNRVSIPNLLLSIFLLMNFDVAKKSTPYSSYIIRIHSISIMLYFALSGIPALSSRLSELVGIVGILTWPILLFIVRPQWLAMIFLAIVSVNFLDSSLRYINDYSMLN